ncbi:MAG: hypothetical protein KUG80_07670 [Gammaproteobacteria bacterium]|nr:hypothetical protein [Gammaproteobacteria bacterium]
MANNPSDTTPNKAELDSLTPYSSSVQSLIDRIHSEGVDSAQQAGEKIIAEAEHRGEWILAQAREEAELIRQQAQQNADFMQKAGKDALALACRDSILSLKNNLLNQFSEHLQNAVNESLQDVELLKAMILEIARGSADQSISEPSKNDKPTQLLLPNTTANNAVLKDNPDNSGNIPLTQFVNDEFNKLLKLGIELVPNGHDETGIILRKTHDHVQVELTDKAITELLMKHLQPRFRTILEGIVS